MKYYCALPLLLFQCLAQTPAPKSAREAWDYIQQRRHEAQALDNNGDTASIDKAIQILKDVLSNELVSDLANGSRYVASGRTNIQFDLAQAYALQGKDAECLDSLRRMLTLFPDPKAADFLEKSGPLKRLHDNPEFRQIVAQFRAFADFWNSPALATPYRENLSDAEKLAGLSKFWSEVKYNFGFPEKLLAVNWDKLYLEWIPKVLATPSTAAYYRELQALCARLTDGHTAVSPPRALAGSKPPLYTRLIEGHVMILRVDSPSLQSDGIVPGMEITAVNGESATDYARRELGPYQSASTPQDLLTRIFTYAFLTGPSDEPVELKLRTPSGAEIEKAVARTGFHDVAARPGFEWRMLPGKIAYVAVNRLDQQSVANQFGAAFPKILESSSLILDLRLNGGGNSNIGFAILQYLLLEPVLGQRQIERVYHPTDRARSDEVIGTLERPGFPINPREGERYRNPIVVLTGPATYSATEDFLIAWQSSGRGKTIGEPTGGSTGQPLNIALPGGGSARICSKKDTFADGRVWEGIGIQPDILVRPTLADVRAGRDTVLDRAVAYLQGRTGI